MPMIETINLTKKYNDLIALDNLNLSIEEGACLGFIGPNGAGKTTTIKILATLLKPTWGEARIDGKVVGYQNHLIRPLIGYVPDFLGAYEDMVVVEYLEFFAACYGIHGKPLQFFNPCALKILLVERLMQGGAGKILQLRKHSMRGVAGKILPVDVV